MVRRDPFKSVWAKCKTLSDFPYVADIELTNLCNFHCQMCPVGLNMMMRQKGMLSFDLFQARILPELVENKCAIRFVRWGEPLYHPRFSEFVRLVKKHKLLLHINTNGSLCDDEILDFINVYVDSIKFSFQGLGKEEYERIRIGGKFDKLCGRIKYLSERRGNKHSPFIEIGTTVADVSNTDCEDFKKSFAGVADRVSIGETYTPVSDGLIRKQDRRFDSCPEIGGKISINWDGTVSACCADFNNLLLVGDLRKETIREVWNGEKLGKIREMIRDGQAGLLPLCKYCLK